MGEIEAGKSTILNKAMTELKLTTCGFKTLPLLKEGQVTGFYIESLGEKKRGVKKSDKLIGEKIGPNKCKPITKTFETKGVEILKNSLQTEEGIIVMDELGFLERGAVKFQQFVFRCCAAERIVAGVIKEDSNPFLDKLRRREDVKIIRVTKKNRNRQYKKCKNYLRKLLS